MMKAKHSLKKDVKSKEGSTTPGKVRSRSPEVNEDTEISLPILKTVDKARSLHCYSSILSKPKEEGLSMEEVDRLQPELEALLSAVAVRLRTLQAELHAMSPNDSLSPPPSQKKRKVSEARVSKSMKDLSKVRDREGTTKLEGTSSGNETDGSNEGGAGATVPLSSKMVIPKNDTPNKFWASVEPYCSEITPENIKELEEMVEVCERDAAGCKVPPLGKHYTARWAEEDLAEERDAASARRKSDEPSPNNLIKRASAICGRERSSGPLVQRLVSALMEENVTTPLHESYLNNKLEESDSLVGKLPNYHTSACFERRIRRELEAVGMLHSNSEETDEILDEIKKCDEELRIVATENRDHLRRLLGLARQELARQQIRTKIRAVDSEILEMLRKTTGAKLKKKQLQKKEKDQAWKALKEREALLKALDSM